MEKRFSKSFAQEKAFPALPFFSIPKIPSPAIDKVLTMFTNCSHLSYTTPPTIFCHLRACKPLISFCQRLALFFVKLHKNIHFSFTPKTRKKIKKILKNPLTDPQRYDIILNVEDNRKPKRTVEKRNKAMTIETLTIEKYTEIANLLDECVGDVYLYGIEEVAIICGVPVEVVKYVDRAEHE